MLFKQQKLFFKQHNQTAPKIYKLHYNKFIYNIEKKKKNKKQIQIQQVIVTR